jgi:hypothetical protein
VFLGREEDVWISLWCAARISRPSLTLMPSLLTCLRCDCVGVVDETSSDNLIVNCICQCQTCTSGCCYQNINMCKICDSLYRLQWDETQQKCVYLCPNYCPIQLNSKRLTPINSTNVNVALPPWNRTLLHSAVQTCDVELIWELLLKGANPFAKDYRGITPMEIAYAMNRTLSASSKWSETGQSKKQNLERLQQILRIFPEYKPPSSPIFMQPTLAKRNFSEGTHHISKSDATGTTNSFPLPPDIVRSVTSPGRSTAPGNIEFFNPPPPPEANPPVAEKSAPADASGHLNSLEEGTQLYTPLTLIRLTSEGDGVAATVALSEEEEIDDLGFSLFGDDGPSSNELLSSSLADLSISEPAPTNDSNQSAPVPSDSETKAEVEVSEKPKPPAIGDIPNSLLDWKIRELKLAISLETDIESKVSFKEGIYVCTACMEEINASSLGYSCPILGCDGTLCLDCFVRSAHAIISSARYAVPVIRCPGGCMHRIPTKLWRGVLETQSPTPSILEMLTTETSTLSADPSSSSVGTILYEKYSQNAEALMKLRCGCCHCTCGLFYCEDETGDVIPVTPEERLNSLNSLLLITSTKWNQHEQILFLRSWLLFNKGKLSTDTFTTILYDLFEKFLSPEDIELCRQGIFSPLEEKYIKPTLLLFCDVERRLCLQLGFYRKFPKIVTTCCAENHCFMCKVYGHHEDMTCEEMQQNEIGILAQVSCFFLIMTSSPVLCPLTLSSVTVLPCLWSPNPENGGV